MFKKIMVAIDGSKTSREALKEAQNIAASYHGTLCIVYAVADSDDADQQAGLRDAGACQIYGREWDRSGNPCAAR